ncbi:hypothetical protein C8J56DRAFT_386573 [Mycena floridula]|nr:hypothetical protein C8J56DRAFT_386573 [Mycena floridula]
MHPSLTCCSCGHRDVVEKYKSPLPSHLLKTNNPPHPSEVQFLREMLGRSDFEREIADSNAKLDGLAKMRVAEIRRRDEIVETFVAAKGVLSAIRRIPPQLIRQILLLAITGPDGSMKGVSLNVKEGPWVYSQVCRLWRNVILFSTFIWSNIDILYGELQEKNRHSPAILKEIFQRSRLRPLRLNLGLHVDSRGSKEFLVEAVKECERWKDVRLHLASKVTIALKSLKDHIPLLESFHLQFAHYSPVSSYNFSECFSKAPALRRLAFRALRDVHLIQIAWSGLTHFHDRSGDTSFTDLLPKLPNIISLALSSSSRLSTSMSHRFQLNYLRTLDIARCDELPSGLLVPALQELKISMKWFHHISTFIRQSSCHLKHLCIVFPPFPTPTELARCDRASIQTLFRHVPQLLTLELESFFSSQKEGDMAIRITSLLADATLLPALRRLVIGDSTWRGSLESLVRVVQSRQQASSALAELVFIASKVTRPADVLAANLEHIRTIQESGMKVVMNAASSTTFEITELRDRRE